MKSDPACEIYSARLLMAPVAAVYNAFADPRVLARWWGPEGFTNTISEFDLRPGGGSLIAMQAAILYLGVAGNR